MTRIAVDAMGSDNYPTPDVEGAVQAAREYGVEIILVGDTSQIQPVVDSAGGMQLPVRLVHAPEMLTMEDKGEDLVMKARHKDAQNSMAVGLDLVKRGEAECIFPFPFSLASRFHGLAPATTVRLMQLTEAILPDRAENGRESTKVRGKIVEERMDSPAHRMATVLGREAETAFKQTAGEPSPDGVS